MPPPLPPNQRYSVKMDFLIHIPAIYATIEFV